MFRCQIFCAGVYVASAKKIIIIYLLGENNTGTREDLKEKS